MRVANANAKITGNLSIQDPPWAQKEEKFFSQTRHGKYNSSIGLLTLYKVCAFHNKLLYLKVKKQQKNSDRLLIVPLSFHSSQVVHICPAKYNKLLSIWREEVPPVPALSSHASDSNAPLKQRTPSFHWWPSLLLLCSSTYSPSVHSAQSHTLELFHALWAAVVEELMFELLKRAVQLSPHILFIGSRNAS